MVGAGIHESFELGEVLGGDDLVAKFLLVNLKY